MNNGTNQDNTPNMKTIFSHLNCILQAIIKHIIKRFDMWFHEFLQKLKKINIFKIYMQPLLTDTYPIYKNMSTILTMKLVCNNN